MRIVDIKRQYVFPLIYLKRFSRCSHYDFVLMISYYVVL